MQASALPCRQSPINPPRSLIQTLKGGMAPSCRGEAYADSPTIVGYSFVVVSFLYTVIPNAPTRSSADGRSTGHSAIAPERGDGSGDAGAG